MPRHQVAMAATRYEFAAKSVSGAAVLEIACGTGLGLDYLARRARIVVGGDIAPGNLALASRHTSAATLVRLDGHALPFSSSAFDVVVIFEAIYYMSDVETVLRECRRVLRSEGVLFVSLPNAAARGFHPSPRSVRYPSAAELAGELRLAGFHPRMFGAFPVAEASLAARLVARATRLAERLRIVPSTLQGRARLKQLFFRNVQPFRGLEEAGFVPDAPVPIDEAGHDDFTVLYARAQPARAAAVTRGQRQQ